MGRKLISAVAIAASGLLALTACGDDGSSDGSSSNSEKVGVILPDTATSARWETADRPLLTQAFKDAGVGYDIQNAGGDTTKFATIADGMISSGVKVLMITNLDSDSGAAVIKKAAAAGIPVIDYDRLTLGGGANYYVSFDNVLVGKTMGEGLVKALKAKGKNNGPVVTLNGSPTDNNATLFKQGYDEAIKTGGYTVAADQSVKEWDNQLALTDFEQIFTKLGPTGFEGVVAANDGLAGSVASVLAKNNLSGQVPVTGQDATDEGLQRVLLGTQYVTVYKAIKKEADAASSLAIQIIKGDKAGADAAASAKSQDTVLNKEVPSVLLTPQAIYKENVGDVITDGYTTKDKVCTTAELKKICDEVGIK